MQNNKRLIQIANIGLNSQTNILDNIIQIEHAILQTIQHHQQQGKNLDLVVLPENAFCFGQQKFASRYFDSLKNWCGKLAEHYQIHLLAGTLPCPYRPDGTPVADEKLRQTSLLFDPSGDCVARYDKIHLFKATVNDTTANYDEGLTFEAGDTPVVARTAIGDIGLMVCFDLRFASLATRLRQMRANILTAPSAFTYMTGKAHWQTLLTARALDSQCLVIGAAQGGEHFIPTSKGVQTRQTWGHGQVINAFGERIDTDLPLQSIDSKKDVNNLLSNLPLATLASQFLEKSSLHDNDNTVKFPNLATVTLAEFDSEQQNQFRNNINLLASSRFGIIDPISIDTVSIDPVSSV